MDIAVATRRHDMVKLFRVLLAIATFEIYPTRFLFICTCSSSVYIGSNRTAQTYRRIYFATITHGCSDCI